MKNADKGLAEAIVRVLAQQQDNPVSSGRDANAEPGQAESMSISEEKESVQRAMKILIQTLEILGNAIASKDKEKAFEAVTIFLMQFVGTFGPERIFFNRIFPVLEELKDHILDGQFEESERIVLTLRSALQEVNSELEESTDPANRVTHVEDKIQ